MEYISTKSHENIFESKAELSFYFHNIMWATYDHNFRVSAEPQT